MESVCDGKVHMSSSIQRECQPLMEACTSSLYQNNAFRVTGLHIHASTRIIKRRLDELKMAAELNELEDEFSHALALDPPPSVDQIQNAGRRLQDVQSRFIDEFFWFWPINWALADSDAALLALANGDRSKAENIWHDQLSGHHSDEACAAIHNLAVLFHILALDLEHLHLRSGPPMLPEQIAQMDSNWKTSFKYWERLVDHEPFWSLVSERVRAINDPGISTGFVHRFRKCFPVAFDNINASLASALAKQGKHSRAALHIKFMQETHQGLDDTDATLQQITRPLHTRIDHAVQQATGNLNDDPKSGAIRTDQLLRVTEEPLKALSTLLGADHPEVEETTDEVVEACCNCVIAYGNATKDWRTGVELLEKIFDLVVGSKLRTRIHENLEIMRSNQEYARRQNIPPSVPPQYRRETGGARTPTYTSKPGSLPSGSAQTASTDPNLNLPWGCFIPVVVVVIFIIVIGLSDSSSSSSSHPVPTPAKSTYQSQSTPVSKPAYNTSASTPASKPAYNSVSPYNTYSSSPSSRSTLGREIDDGKNRAKLLGAQIELKDAEIADLERTMNSYRSSNTDEYNRLVPRFNSMVKDRNKVQEEHKQLVDSVNAKVRQYNASR